MRRNFSGLMGLCASQRSLALALALCAVEQVSDARASTVQPVKSADATPPTSKHRAIDSDGVQPDEIIVQARRRNESILRTPVIIQALTATEVRNLRITDTFQLASVTPGLTITPISAIVGSSPNLRGIGNGDSAQFIDQSILLNIDGASLPNGVFYRSGLFDVGQIEVLKGPQALFFGKSSTAGIISIRTADPTDHWEASETVGYEIKAEEVRTEGYLSGPITPDLGIRLAGFYGHINGYDKNPNPNNPAQRTPGGEENGQRLTLRYNPVDSSFRANLKFTRSELSQNGSSGEFNQYKCAGSSPQITGAIYDDCKINDVTAGVDRVLPYRPDLNYSPFNTASFTEGTPSSLFNHSGAYSRVNTTAAVLNMDYNLSPGFTITSLSSYSHVNASDATALFIPNDGTIFLATANRVNDYAQEIRLTSDWPTSWVNFTAGALYDSLNGRGRVALVLPTVPIPGLGTLSLANDNNFAYRQKTGSAFVQLLLTPISKLELSVGARYTHVHKYFTSLVATNNYPSFFFPGPSGDQISVIPESASVGGTARSIKENNTSPEVTLTYRPTPNLTAFVSYKRGYKGPGFSVNTTATTYNPAFSFASPITTIGGEKVSGWEGGVKGSVLDRQISFNISAYNFLYRNLQVGIVNNVTLSTQVFNGADARVKGVEAGANFRPAFARGVTVGGFVNYNHGNYISFASAPCYGGETAAEGCVNGSQSLASQPLAKAPRWTGNFEAGYQTAVGNSYQFSTNLRTRFSGRYESTPEHNPVGIQPSYMVLDGSVHFGPKNEAWSIAVLGRNLTNKIYVTDGSDTGFASPGGVADVTASTNRPRQIMLQLTLRQ